MSSALSRWYGSQARYITETRAFDREHPQAAEAMREPTFQGRGIVEMLLDEQHAAERSFWKSAEIAWPGDLYRVARGT